MEAVRLPRGRAASGISRLAGLVVALLMTLGACTEQTPQLTTDSTGDDPPTIVPPNAVLVDTRNVLTQQYSGIADARRVAIRTVADWEAFWREAMGVVEPLPPAPAVDFASEMIIVAAMGQRPTAGYAISIDEVYAAEGQLFVVLTETSPPPGAIVAQAITAPLAAVALPASGDPIVFISWSGGP